MHRLDDKTNAQKHAASKDGGKRTKDADALDRAWAEVQAKSRAGLGWKAPQCRN